MTTWTWIGRWRREGDSDWPDPVDLADPGWDVDQRSFVATYLEKDTFSPVFMARTWPDGTHELGERCQLCEGDELIGFDYVTDGTYVWPEGLVHYVEMHSVRLPSQVVDHILQQQPYDFEAIRARTWDQIMTTWRQGEHDRSWWRDVTSHSAD